nr:hydroxysteroid 11-beta-dehydrogenase 1-like protein isoform X1 [Vulpes vulpes]XP_025875095.1 hydroxysteroid 11-beta-dehydrogenase 1-like protein isoform X1 [Vulpes vulpes]XP_025875096.1 hydroxysteroid 11-beta-dehydrogenase 1-like protein isoform X1 [Vulpes vulpes]
MKVLLLTGLGALFFSYYWDDNFDPASLQGARVLLTGASAGVGEELAYHYARLGSHLVLTAHTEAFLQKVVGNCRKLGAPEVFYIAADMASPEVPGRVVQFALDKLGGLDYLVLNHLGATPAGTRSRSVQGTRWLLQVNLLSYVQLTSLALPSLTDSRGSLVVVSSLLGRVPTSFSSPYSAAKFALDGFFGSLRRELDVQDVNVAITVCVLGLRDRASAAEAVRSSTSPLSPLPLPELPGRRSFVFPEGSPPSSRPRAATPIETPLSGWPRPETESSRQKRKSEKNLPAPGKSRNPEFASADRVPGTWSATWKAFPVVRATVGDVVAASILQMRKLRLRQGA